MFHFENKSIELETRTTKPSERKEFRNRLAKLKAITLKARVFLARVGEVFGDFSDESLAVSMSLDIYTITGATVEVRKVPGQGERKASYKLIVIAK